MSLTMRQRQRLRAGRLCITLPPRDRLDDATKCDIAVIVGALVVLAVSFWICVPIVQDALLLALSAVAGVSGAWVLWSSVRWLRGRG